MANKQSLPTTKLLGAAANKFISAAPIASGEKQVMPDDGDLAVLGMVTNTADLMLKVMQRTDRESAKLRTAATLQNYQRQLLNAQNPEEFDAAFKQNEMMLQNGIGADTKEKDFWRDNGAKIMELNRRDAEAIRQQKLSEFGKISLQQMLSDNQNMLALKTPIDGRNLLQQGVREIDQSPFLDDAEKMQYKNDYLKTGILNLALHTDDEANLAAETYFPDDAAMKQKISDIRDLREKTQQAAQTLREDEKNFSDVSRLFNIWQQKELGEIDDAAFYVLQQQFPENHLWGDKQNKSQTPLYDAYRVLKAKTAGERLNALELKDVGNSFISAYKQREIGLNEAIEWQNRIIGAGDFEKPVFDEADKIFGQDPQGRSVDADRFMEFKARATMDFYDAYEIEKNKLSAQFYESGEALSSATERRLCFEALQNAKDHLGFKGGDDVSFDVLQRAMRSVYYGNQTAGIWENFAKQAPYAEDKTALMRQIAAAAQRKELDLPRFDSYDEVLQARLKEGDKFYFRGRLAFKG